IKEDVNDRLSDHDYLDASDVEVSVDNSEVTLSGTVNGRYEKRLAEDIAESVSGVTHVQNNLRVSQSQYGASTGTTGMSATGSSAIGTTGTSTSRAAAGTSAGTQRTK
ncbi:MAG: BON domain-containing protein, partial [Acidobacteria bacterium]|nr:BON domain-containing protein [Acidobacteriota bacterium]